MKSNEDEPIGKQAVAEFQPNISLTKANADKCDETDELLEKQTVVQIMEDSKKT